mgnify:CR=1 FL=1
MIVKVLHLEPTDSCQAACPQCARETDRTFDKNDQNHHQVLFDALENNNFPTQSANADGPRV